MNDLKSIRKNKGISQMTLAQKVGVSLLTIQLWEKGVTKPNEENQIKLEKTLESLPDKKQEA